MPRRLTGVTHLLLISEVFLNCHVIAFTFIFLAYATLAKQLTRTITKPKLFILNSDGYPVSLKP